MAHSIPFVNLQAQYQAYKNEIDSALQSVLDSSSYIMGESVRELEVNLANYCGAKYARAISSGTDALLVALMALGIKSGDEVITTPFTFIATAEMIALLGAKPVFVDIDESYNIDPSKIESAITNKTKAIIPVSLYGLPCDMDRINEIASKYNLAVIEDACQSFGATYKGKKSCNLSTIGVTSFFPSKPLGCYGDGGAIFCNDSNLDSKIASILNHGQVGRYMHKMIGLNARLDSIQCAILNVKLRYFDKEIAKRVEIARIYSQNLANLVLPQVPDSKMSVFAQYSVYSTKLERSQILESLQEKGIPTAVHYPLPLHLQGCMAYLGYKRGDFPMSEKIADSIFSLPFSAFLSNDEQRYIIDNLNEITK